MNSLDKLEKIINIYSELETIYGKEDLSLEDRVAQFKLCVELERVQKSLNLEEALGIYLMSNNFNALGELDCFPEKNKDDINFCGFFLFSSLHYNYKDKLKNILPFSKLMPTLSHRKKMLAISLDKNTAMEAYSYYTEMMK